jgi:hypothetical protein
VAFGEGSGLDPRERAMGHCRVQDAYAGAWYSRNAGECPEHISEAAGGELLALPGASEGRPIDYRESRMEMLRECEQWMLS